jgi:D-sedoheptulose 7-phosphate isomerase
MKKNLFYRQYFNNLSKLIYDEGFNELVTLEKKILEIKKKKYSIFVYGNGGSAAVASHFNIDAFNKCGIKSNTLGDKSLITCLANDYGFENLIKISLLRFATKKDLVILISSSGESRNMINAAKFCKNKKIFLITLTGFNRNNSLKKLGNINLWVNSKEYNYIENIHQLWLLSALDKISNKLK